MPVLAEASFKLPAVLEHEVEEVSRVALLQSSFDGAPLTVILKLALLLMLVEP